MSKAGPGRATLNKTLALGGVIIILLQTLLIATTRLQVSVILVGILVNQIGVWGLAERLLPDRRVYLKLRAEVDQFIGLVRKLNSEAASGAGTDIETTKTAMHESVERMATVAGVVKQ